MSTSQFRNRPHFSYNLLFFKKPLAKDAHIFRRATLISLTGNHCAPQVGDGVSNARQRRQCRLGNARLRRFRVTKLCRCRVRLRRSRSSRLRITGLYRRNGSGRRSGSKRRNRRNRCRISRRHGSTVAGTAVFKSLDAGRDLLRLFNRHFLVCTILTSRLRDG